MLLNLGWRGQFAPYILFFSVNKALSGALFGGVAYVMRQVEDQE